MVELLVRLFLVRIRILCWLVSVSVVVSLVVFELMMIMLWFIGGVLGGGRGFGCWLWL